MYKVVIAEDELFVRLGVKMSVDWEKLDMEVVADVENGQQALQAWEILKPDIIITDIKMPLMDGISMIRKVREKDMRTRFIILSCLEEFHIVRDAISAGVSDYVLKLTMSQEDMEKVLQKAKTELEILDNNDRKKQSEVDEKQFEEKLRAWLYYRLDMGKKYRSILEKRLGNVNRIVLLEIDRYQECKKIFDDSYGAILDSAVQNILAELLENKPHILLPEKEGRNVLIFREEQETEEISEETLELLESIREIFGRYLKTGVSFGISRQGTGYQELGRLYQQCCQALEKKFFAGFSRNLFWNGQEQEACRLLFARRMDQLIRSVPDEGTSARLKEAKEAFCNQENPANIKHYFEHAVGVQLGKILPDSQQRYQIMEQYTEQIKRSQTLEEVIEIYQEVQTFLRGDKEEKTEYLSKAVKDIISYISEHYAEDITLDQVSRHVELSRTYVSGLFKKEVGVNLTNYITEYRIEKAKELLRDTNLKSYEIAERVGFLDESYFSRIFKKVTGESPNSFKKAVKKV